MVHSRYQEEGFKSCLPVVYLEKKKSPDIEDDSPTDYTSGNEESDLEDDVIIDDSNVQQRGKYFEITLCVCGRDLFYISNTLIRNTHLIIYIS